MKKESRASSQSSETPVSVAPSKTKKPEVNLYEPYTTPTWFWEGVRFLTRIIYFIALRVRLRGRYNIPRQGPYIIAANHLSWNDIHLIPSFVPGKVVFMAKEESFHSSIGKLVRLMGAFPVRRGEADRQAIRASGELLKRGKVFFIFPEGTRSKNRTLAKAQAGVGMIALRADVPVIPVAIWGSENALKKFGAEVTISFGEPIHLKPKGAKISRDDIESSTEEIMHRIASMLPVRYRGVYTDAVSDAKEELQVKS